MRSRTSLIVAVNLLFCVTLFPQEKPGISKGATAEHTIINLTNPSLYSTTSGFDERYEGVKGSPRLFDTLLNSTLRLKERKDSLILDSDLDVVKNMFIFLLRSSNDLLEVPAVHIDQVVYHTPEGDLLFRTTDGLSFDKKIRDIRFCQILAEEPLLLIKIPGRNFQEAQFTGLYSPDKRYDEYTPADRYYITGSDSLLHQVQLTRRSLSKVLPQHARAIRAGFNERSDEDPELQVIRLLERL